MTITIGFAPEDCIMALRKGRHRAKTILSHLEMVQEITKIM
jgi:hypothetical protein